MEPAVAQKSIITVQDAQKHFEKDLEKKKKLDELRSTVFKNFTIKKSKSIVHPAQTLTILKNDQHRQTFHFPKEEKEKNGSTLKNDKDNQSPSVNNIRFDYSRPSRSNSVSVIKDGKSLPTFFPRKTAYNVKKTSFEVE